jgi:dihydroorotate dehydrogenase
VAPLYPAVRSLLFRCDPETSHRLGIAALRLAQAVPGAVGVLARRNLVDGPALRQDLFGRVIVNPVGLAAGFDKDAAVAGAMAALGFGFVEVGTVTPEPQAGNPRPRLFRHAAAASLQNSLGFNNHGMEAMRRRLLRLRRRAGMPLGVNLGKGRATPAAAALADYEALLARLGDLADYLVVNLSSPNTPGLRDLQNEGFVRDLMQAAAAITRTPVLVKLSPDLDPRQAAVLAAAAVSAGAAGIVATNTTTDYTVLAAARDQGGISGRALRARSRQVLAAVAGAVGGKGGGGALLISAGGIDSGAEAYARIRAGASLVQVYTALVYEGPSLPRRINRDLLALLDRDGFTNVRQAVGADLPGAGG